MSLRSFARRFVVPVVALALLTGCGGGLGSKTESGNVEVYYKDGATKEEADRLAAYVAKTVPGGGDKRTFQLLKKGDGYQIRFPLKKEYQTNEKFLGAMGLDGSRYSADVFNGAPVEIEACTETMTALRTVPHQPDLRRRYHEGKIEIFYPDTADKAEVEKLGKVLQPMAAASPAPTITFKFDRRDKTALVAMVVNPALVNAPEAKASLDELRKAIAKEAFGGAPTELQLCDEFMTPLQTLK